MLFSYGFFLAAPDVKAFRACGMISAVDGREDHLFRVPGIKNYDIGESEDEQSDGESESSGSSKSD